MTTAPTQGFEIAERPDAACTLPGWAYTDPGVFERERNAIHRRCWHYAGSTQELAAPGSYLTARLLDQTIIVIRIADGTIRGFYNVCQHRAHELLQGRGRVQAITCPYHAWTYGIDGRFRGGRGTAGFTQAGTGAFDLKPVRVETLAGRFVFFNLDAAATPLSEQAAGLAAELRAEVPAFDELAIAGPPASLEIQANWKVAVDNYLECYHCRPAHPAFAAMLDMDSLRVETHAYWMSQKANLGGAGTSAYPIGRDLESTKALFWWLWPTTTFNVLPGAPELSVTSYLPLGPAKSLQWGQRFALPGAADDAARQRYRDGQLTDEDVSIVESVQRGLSSYGYVAGRFVSDPRGGEISEAAVHRFHRLVAAALAPE